MGEILRCIDPKIVENSSGRATCPPNFAKSFRSEENGCGNCPKRTHQRSIANVIPPEVRLETHMFFERRLEHLRRKQ